jgi:ribulose-phosphate 3-epimerase
MKIVPALLTNSKGEFKRMLEICRDFSDYLQIDIMDGKFVPSQSVDSTVIASFVARVACEAHLMVNDPLGWISVFKKFGAQRIIFHFEIKNKHLEIIQAVKTAGLEAGLAINPDTQIKDFEALVDKLDAVLFMSVVPGFYGAKFIPAVLTKIKDFKKRYPKIITGVDGGIKPDNVREVAQSGVDYICVGSAILATANPKEAYLKIINLLK